MKRMSENWQKMLHLTWPEEIKILMSEFSNQSLEYLILPESKRMLKKNKPKLTGVHQRDTGGQSKKLPIAKARTTWAAK